MADESSNNSPQFSMKVPLLIVAGALLLLMVMVRFAFVSFYEPHEEKGPDEHEAKREQLATAVKEAKENLKEAKKQQKSTRGDVIATTIVKRDEWADLERVAVKRESVVPHSADPAEGSKSAKLTLVVFSDPLCKRCQDEVDTVLDKISPYSGNLQVVYKFMPEVEGANDGGIFARVAKYGDVYEPFIKRVNRYSGVIDTDKLSEFLEDAGLPFDKQRNIMAKHMPDILGAISDNYNDAKRLKVYSPPAFFLNGYRVDEEPLIISNVPTYAENLLRGRQIDAR